MSAGTFLKNAKYETGKGPIVRVRIQPETLTLTLGGTSNDEPAGAITPNYPRAKVSKSNREFGIGTRGVYFFFTGTLPDGYAPGVVLFLPILTPALFNTLEGGVTGNYTLGGTAFDVEVLGVKPESFR